MSHEAPSDPLIAPLGTMPAVATQVVESIGVASSSTFGNYFAEKGWISGTGTGPDGHYVNVAPAEYTKRDEILDNVKNASDEVSQGRIGTAGILLGSINGHIGNRSDDSGSRNLRSEIEHINDLLGPNHISGSTSFHEMFAKFNPEHATAELTEPTHKGIQNDSLAEQQFISIARQVIDNGGRPVLYNGIDGKPSGKVEAILDADGNMVPNVFMRINSGIFNDKDGSASSMSNIVNASLIMFPEGMLDVTVATEVFNSGESSAEMSSVPDAKAIELLHSGLPSQNKIGGKNAGGEFSDYFQREPLAELQNPDGTSSAITNLVFVGDSVIGLVNKYDDKKQTVESSVVLLPIGAQASEIEGPKSLATLNIEESKKPRTDTGAIKSFESVKIGRVAKEGLSVVADGFVSAEHATIDITNEGRMHVRDLSSSNGTGYMNMDTLFSRENFANDIAYEAALAVRAQLVSNPDLWAVS